MAEHAFLDAVADYLENQANLTPTPSTVGFAVPDKSNEMPAIVLWLEGVRHTGRGLGQRNILITDGVLPWSAAIDLANPVLATDPDFVLLSPDRRELTLPHSGLVRSDGTRGDLSASDIEVRVGNSLRTLVPASPSGSQYTVDPVTGLLTFGSPLPGSGEVTASYFLAQWEQQVAQIAGDLVIDVVAVSADDVAGLSRSVLEALQSPVVVDPRIKGLRVTQLSRIGLPDTNNHNARTRTIRMDFEFESVVNVPEPSGGLIRHVPITGELQVLRGNAATGAITVDTETEETEVPIGGPA